MPEYIKKLQSKSEIVRKQILVGSLVVCMAFVGVIWISTLGYKFSKENTANTQDVIKPFALFGQTLSDTYSNVSASVGNISSSLKNSGQKVAPKSEKQIDLIPVEIQNQ
jgi:hypothetical protein